MTKPDVAAMLNALWLPAFLWLLMVTAATVSGYPGVVCMTPVGWLMGLNVGQRAVARSRSPRPIWPLAEATVAGAALGLWQGLVMVGVGLLGGGIEPTDRPSIMLAGIVVSLLGAVVCALLALALGAVQQRNLS